jgi:DNA repair exonuclease SbcCD ATPase subunit
MYRMIDFECENFIGLYNGLNTKRTKLDLRAYRDKSVFIILGGNAKGKSTLGSTLHPFPGTTDKRTHFIRENREGYKQILYENQDDDSITISIRHVYTPKKDGGHTTKSFIHKTIDGQTLDLNPNGNISTFLLAVEQEFGIGVDFMRLSAQNEDMVSLVEMTGSERKDHIYSFIPKADDTSVYQRIVTRKYGNIKLLLSSIVDKLGKMQDEVTIKEKLKEIEARTNELVERRDKNIGKINKYEAEIKALDPDDKLLERTKRIRSELRRLNEDQDKLQSKIDKLSGQTSYTLTSIYEIDSVMSNIMSEMNKVRGDLIQTTSSISSRRQIKSNLYDSIEEKESMIRQLAGEQSHNDMVNLLAEYEGKISKFDKRTKNMNTVLTADDLIHGIDIIDNLRTFLFDIHNNVETQSALEEACASIFSNKFENRYAETSKKLDVIKDKKDKMNLNISSLAAFEHLKDTIDKRPHNCVIDTCGFLQDYQKWVVIEAKINTLTAQLDDLNQSYDDLFAETTRLADVHRLKLRVEALVTFYKSNLSLLSKLPFNERYSTQDKLINCVLKRDMLADAEAKFYDLIEILQDKKEYDEIKNVKIPVLTSQLKSLTDNHTMVKTLKTEIDKLEKRHATEVSEIARELETESDLLTRLDNLLNEESLIIEMKERMLKLNDHKSEIIKLSNEFDSVKDISERIEENRLKLEERRDKLKEIDSKLKPLTKERDQYKYHEIKIAEYKMEQEVLEKNLRVLTLVRKALSTNKGIPVSIMNMYVEEIRKGANMLLSDTFEGSLYLEKFDVNENEFTIPYQHNGDGGKDISRASSSERSFISTCLSMSMIEQIIANYGILNLDEVDAGFSEQNRAVYCAILMKQIKRIGINQVFFITHSREYYEPYDVCYILFPEHTLKTSGKDVIMMY